MRLKDFLKLKNWTASDLARALDVKRATVGYWLDGRRRIPRRDLLAKIHKLSDGAVDYHDFAK